MDNQATWIDDQNVHHYHIDETTNTQAQHEETIGDGMVIPKPNTITRIYCQNANGISVGRNSDFDVTLEQARHMEIDIFLIIKN
jgi:hypothetical protein